MPDRQTHYDPLPDVVCTELDDGEAVLLHLVTRQYYTLNETGARVWNCIGRGMSLTEIIDDLTRQYAVEALEAQAYVDAYLRDLEGEGLVTPRPI